MQSNKRVTVSRGNRKLGAIMNVSTEPVRCCLKGIPCAEGGCYALKSLRLYPQTRKAWAKNARIAKTNPRSYFSQIASSVAEVSPADWLEIRKPTIANHHAGAWLTAPLQIDSISMRTDACSPTNGL